MAAWQSELPIPVYHPHPEYNELYFRAWELARRNVKTMPGMPQNPVMKEGYLDFYIWIWDTCFMSLFTKYAQKSFPGYQSLHNFYEVLHDGKRLPEMTVTDKPFPWLTQNVGDVVPVLISLADNPPLFAWAEWSNLLFHGELEYLQKNVWKKHYLEKHFQMLESFRAPGTMLPGVDLPTSLVKNALGYRWSGLASGMDNSPRGRTGNHVSGKNAANPDMLWVDAIAQQAFSALLIHRMANCLGEFDMAKKWRAVYENFKSIVNRYYWDDEDGFYYDISARDHHFYKVMTPASFWVMLAEIPSRRQAERMAQKLEDAELLGGFVPCVSLARNDSDFNGEHGHYWRGGLWLPTAYATIKALECYGMFKLARKLSSRILHHQYMTWKNFSPHTIWECYAPNSYEPAQTGDSDSPMVRKDFCGWSALGPISLYIENVIGIYSVDPFSRTVHWHLPEADEGPVGVYNLHFGDVTADLIYQNGQIKVNANRPVTVVRN